MNTKGTVYFFTGLSGAGKTTLGTLLYENLKKQKSERLSRRNMELYVNLENEDKKDSNMPDIEKRVIKLDVNIPEDEDFGL